MPEYEKGGMGRLSFFLRLSQAKITALRGEIEDCEVCLAQGQRFTLM